MVSLHHLPFLPTTTYLQNDFLQKVVSYPILSLRENGVPRLAPTQKFAQCFSRFGRGRFAKTIARNLGTKVPATNLLEQIARNLGQYPCPQVILTK